MSSVLPARARRDTGDAAAARRTSGMGCSAAQRVGRPGVGGEAQAVEPDGVDAPLLRGGWGAAAGRVGGAHEADGGAVRVGDDGVAGTPERVVRRLSAGVAGGREVLVRAVDGVPVGEAEADDHARRPFGPALVPPGGEGGAVDVEVEPARHDARAVVAVPGLRLVGDLDAQAPVEIHRRLHVRGDEVDLVEHGPPGRRRRLPTARDRAGEDAERGPQGRLRDDREDLGVAPDRVDARPVVVGGHQRGAVLRRLEGVAVDVADLRAERALDRPRDLAVLLEGGDDDGDVVLAERVVVERLPVHVDDEPIADRADRRPLGGQQHPGAVDGHVPPGIGQHPEHGGGAGGDQALDGHPIGGPWASFPPPAPANGALNPPRATSSWPACATRSTGPTAPRTRWPGSTPGPTGPRPSGPRPRRSCTSTARATGASPIRRWAPRRCRSATGSTGRASWPRPRRWPASPWSPWPTSSTWVGAGRSTRSGATTSPTCSTASSPTPATAPGRRRPRPGAGPRDPLA